MKTLLYTIAVLFMLLLSSCKRDKDSVKTPPNGNGQELITTVKVILTNVANSSDVRTVEFNDLDGPGGNAPTIGSLTLAAGEVYEGEVILLDRTKVPEDSISNEVYEERDEHQFFYTVSGADLTITYESTDLDDNGVPLGLYPKFTVGPTTGTGTFTVILKHQPGLKPTSGNGDITLGDTDVEVTFDVTIQ